MSGTQVPVARILPRRKQLLTILALGLVAASLFGWGQWQQEKPRQTIIHAVGPEYALEELRAESTLVIHARVTDREARWNNSENVRWAAADDHVGPEPMIYTSNELEILRIASGDLRATTVTVITPGGIVGEDQFVFEGWPDLQVGSEYMLVLRQVSIPTRDGDVEAWTPLALGQGIFERKGNVFENQLALTATPDDFR